MTRIIIQSNGGQELEVERATFDAGFFPDYYYVRDAGGGVTPVVPAYLDAEFAAAVGSPTTQTAGALRAAYVPFLTLALNPDMLITGTITRDANGAATSAPVTWPDGTTGTYTADTVSTAFPGAVDAYHVTYAGTTTKTYTQPAVTRDSNGAVTARPALTVA